ncbi:MAG: hypothetical protein RL265_377 [Bacteroidota bacterium]|jgi:uncharacterized protein (TIGR01777 family)
MPTKMETKKVVIAGGTGFIGSYLAERFAEKGYSVQIISRSKKHLHWKETEKVIEAISGAELLLNFTGKSVDCRYNYKNKWKILTSRTESTLLLHKLVAACPIPPKMWFNSSTATIYRHSEDRPMTENEGEIGSGFSVHVAESWENAFFSKELAHTKQIALRIAIVLGKGGALVPLKALTKFGFGGKQGAGNQMVSWIHIEDLYESIHFLQHLENPAKIYNCSAPKPIRNDLFMQDLRTSMHVPFGIPLSKRLLEFGAFFIRTEPEMILKSRWVLPERLVEAGFEFRYKEITEALTDLKT